MDMTAEDLDLNATFDILCLEFLPYKIEVL